GITAQTRVGSPQRDQRRLGNRKVLPEHESQMTRLLIPAFTEEGLLYPRVRQNRSHVVKFKTLYAFLEMTTFFLSIGSVLLSEL
ncbi:MAG: hypothetical protein NTY17_15695, partial [Planctomycetia bacterium]|nr:hypothetical protein [Planctomycetia bacterium]